jgi:hypothetical protein
MSEFVVRNAKAKVINVLPQSLVWRWLKQSCPDGIYSVSGPKTDCTIERSGGMLYPTSGIILGVEFDPRNLEECQQLFGEGT